MVLAIAEFYHWLGEMGLPGPLLVAAGVLLAVAANRGKQINLPWRSPHAPSLRASKTSTIGQSSAAVKPIASSINKIVEATMTEATMTEATPVQPPRPSVELPQFDKPSQPKPISFTVRKPE